MRSGSYSPRGPIFSHANESNQPLEQSFGKSNFNEADDIVALFHD
jgi:hypothetical protein